METKDDTAIRYVLFKEAAGMAAKSGNIALLVKAVDETAKLFAVDGADSKARALASAASAVKTPEDFTALAKEYLKIADEYYGAENYDAAVKAAQSAQKHAQAAKDMPLVAKAKARALDMTVMADEALKTKTALKALESNSDDAGANLVVGRFLCLYKGDFEKGLPRLAKGSDPVLKALAEKEIALPVEPKDQLALGDGWWDLSEKEKSPNAKMRLMARAGYWYAKAKPGLSRIAKEKASRRMQESKQDDIVLDVKLDAKSGWRLVKAEKGTEIQTDRKYSITSLPKELEGATLIQTPNTSQQRWIDNKSVSLSGASVAYVAVMWSYNGRVSVTGEEFKNFKKDGWQLLKEPFSTTTASTQEVWRLKVLKPASQGRFLTATQ